MCLFTYLAVVLCSTCWKTTYQDTYAKSLESKFYFTETCNCSTITTSDRFISQYFPPISSPLLQARIFLPVSVWAVSTTDRLETCILFPQMVFHLWNLISCLLASSWRTACVTRAQTPSHFLQKRHLRNTMMLLQADQSFWFW